MALIWTQRVKRKRASPAMLCSALALLMCACGSTSRPPDPAGPPRANAPPYPVLLTENQERREVALAAWSKLTQDQGIVNAPAPELQPVTATLRSLPTLSGAPLSLPKVGEGTPMTEEETRESLRRFISDASRLSGAQPQQLSLVQRTDLADGTKKARYEQRPFRLPLRGGYGILEISFTPTGRILEITSTCIPEVEQLQRAGAGTTPRLKAEEVAEQITGRAFTFTAQEGSEQNFTVAKTDQINVRELVVYPVLRTTEPATLEFHLAWEIIVGDGASGQVIYLDAVTNKLIAARAQNS